MANKGCGALLLCLRCRRREGPGCHGNKRKSPGCHGNKSKAPEHEAPPPPLLQNQLLLRPPSSLLGSTRDLCEEQESTPPQGAEPDNVSVTEVMKDSAAREEAYLRQPSHFYWLVPGLEGEGEGGETPPSAEEARDGGLCVSVPCS